MPEALSYSNGTKFHLIARLLDQSAVNIEPAMCNDHLFHSRGQCWRVERVGSLTQRERGR